MAAKTSESWDGSQGKKWPGRGPWQPQEGPGSKGCLKGSELPGSWANTLGDSEPLLVSMWNDFNVPGWPMRAVRGCQASFQWDDRAVPGCLKCWWCPQSPCTVSPEQLLIYEAEAGASSVPLCLPFPWAAIALQLPPGVGNVDRCFVQVRFYHHQFSWDTEIPQCLKYTYALLTYCCWKGFVAKSKRKKKGCMFIRCDE